MEDLGPKIAYVAVEEGTPVYDRQGDRIGVVEHVLIDADIFEGLIIHTRPIAGRHLFADVDQIAELHERGVLLAVDRTELHELDEQSGTSGGSKDTVESPLEGRLRRAWDWIYQRL